MAKRKIKTVIRGLEIEIVVQDSLEIDEVVAFRTEGYLAAKKVGQDDTLINTRKVIRDELIYRGGTDYD